MRSAGMVTNPVAIAIAIAVRPWLWRVVWRFRPDGSVLPIPPPEYLHFRLQTMYGGEAPWTPAPVDVVGFLRWARGVTVEGD